jgi:L-cysteine/cystine lyase
VAPDLQTVRRHLPLLATEAYLNTGGAGPLPDVVSDAVSASMRCDLARGRMGPAGFVASTARRDAMRARAAALVGGNAEEVALTQNTTAGMNAVIWGLDLAAGDEVITTDGEHPGLMVPLTMAARRRGVRLRIIPAAAAEADLAGAVAGLLTAHTRLVALSHISYVTGALLDVAGAAREATRVGAITLVDGAQSVGAIAVDAVALGVDAYAFPAQKWLLGPEGLGALWVRPQAFGAIALTFSGYDAGTAHTPAGEFTVHTGARRFESSTQPLALIDGWLAALDWLDGLGWPWIFARTADTQAQAACILGDISGVEVVTPSGVHAGLTAFTVQGVDPERAWLAMAAKGVVGRWLGDPSVLRVSTGFFTSDDDLDRLAKAVAGLVG